MDYGNLGRSFASLNSLNPSFSWLFLVEGHHCFCLERKRKDFSLESKEVCKRKRLVGVGLVCFVKGSLLGLLQFTHLEVYLVDMSIRGIKDGFMNILKQLSLI